MTGPAPSTHGRGEPRVTLATARQRLSRMTRLRLTRGSALAAVLTLLLGLAVVAQVRSTQAGDLEALRESDLVALLDDVTRRADGLEEEVRALQTDRDRLGAADGDAAAQQAAQERLDSYRILAGTVPVSGEGVTLTVADPNREITPTTVIDLIQELRDAGAEAIQIGDVRVVANTWISPGDDGVSVHGIPVPVPYRVLALGDAHTLSAALAIPGGFNDTVRRSGGEVRVSEGEDLVVDAVSDPQEAQFARPVPDTTGR